MKILSRKQRLSRRRKMDRHYRNKKGPIRETTVDDPTVLGWVERPAVWHSLYHYTSALRRLRWKRGIVVGWKANGRLVWRKK